MRTQWWMVGGMVAVGMVATASAEPGKGRGHSQPQSTSEHVERAGKRVANEAVDAVANEVAGTSGSPSSSGMPPGLAKQDKVPPGLAKQNKTPPGWKHGKKQGWENGGAPKQESLIRRVIHGIFHRQQPPTSPESAKTK